MTHTQILGFAGRKQAGKDTACNFILATKIAELGISKSTRLTSTGEIEVTDILDDSVSGQEWTPFKSPSVDVDNLFENELGQFIKIYSFADKLKHVCVDILGLKKELVFGNGEQKNTKTHIKWDVVHKDDHSKSIVSIDSNQGYMTVREVLQHVGTEMFRGLDPNVWINACLNEIQEDAPELALVSDVRFENEIKAIQDHGGFVVGLTRSPYQEQTENHISEISPQKCLELCDAVVNNDDLSIPQQNKQIYLAIKHLNNIPDIL